MKIRFVLMVLGVALITLVAPAPDVPAQSGSGLATFPRSVLTIESDGKSHRFSVEVARTPHQQRQGLMFRRSMPADAGMLFVYPRSREISMWMRNTLIPLDMLFIGEDGRIARIAQRTVPMSEEIISSGGPVRAVLELNAGTVSRLGIGPGDEVRSPDLGAGEVPR